MAERCFACQADLPAIDERLAKALRDRAEMVEYATGLVDCMKAAIEMLREFGLDYAATELAEVLAGRVPNPELIAQRFQPWVVPPKRPQHRDRGLRRSGNTGGTER